MSPSRLEKVTRQASEFSNYAAKYLQHIAATADDLVARLEQAGLRDEVHLLQPPWDLEREMNIVLHVAPTPADRIRFLGCYYAFQYLRLNVQAVDALRAGLVPGSSRDDVYRQFLATVANGYAALVVTFMRKTMDVITADMELPPFVICGVGTLTDQDDIDVGVVTAAEERRDALNSALSRLSTVMLRYATRLHFYLSEKVSPDSFVTTVAAFEAFADEYPAEYIVASELLNAEPLYGDRALFERFRGAVIDRYYGGSDVFQIYHEGFVRGALGDVVGLAAEPLDTDRVVPKEQGLRLAKTLVHIKRAIHGLRQPDLYQNLATLAQLEPWNAAAYETLAQDVTFLETFRYLYQLLIVQDEVVMLDTPVMRSNLGRVAEMMGYSQRGATGAEENLLVHYYDVIGEIREVASRLVKEVENYLRKTSVFLALGREDVSPEGGVLKSLLQTTRLLARASFWDDLFELLLAADKKLLRTLVGEFNALPPDQREARVNELVGLVKRNAELFIKLLVVLGESRDEIESDELFRAMSAAFLREFATFYNPSREAAQIFAREPVLLNRYLTEVDYAGAKRFMELVAGEVELPALRRPAQALQELCRLRYYGSAYLRRYFRAILRKYPDCLYMLGDMGKLGDKVAGLLGEAALVASPAHKKELLGDYYDLALLRVGLRALTGAPVEETNAEYTEFSDLYLSYLFDACREELAEEYGRWVTSFDVMAIYAAGGHAREWAFNDDYDLIVLIDTEDEKLRELGAAIISAMNAEICKRGIMPHFRFLEHFGTYVVSVRQLVEFFSRRDRTDFIEKSQILESRLVVGTSAFEEGVHERIIEPFILKRADEYIAAMREEMLARQRAVGEVFLPTNIKECVGGLRDIVMAILICKARFGIRDPLTQNILEAIGRVYPPAGLELRSIYNSMCFLKNLRDIYRLTVCVDDNLEFEHAGIVGEVLGFEGDAEGERAHRVKEAFERTTAKVAAEVDALLAKVA